MKNKNGYFVGFNKVLLDGTPKKYTGGYIFCDALFRFSLSKQKTKETFFRGTVSARSSTGKVIYKTLNLNDPKSIKPISTSISIRSNSEREIKAVIEKAAMRLYAKNRAIIDENRIGHVRADNITPLLAFERHFDSYYDKTHPNANEQTRKKEQSLLRKLILAIPNTPMGTISKSDIYSALPIQNTPRANYKKLRDFWKFCIEKRYCTGFNPVVIPPRKRKKRKNKKNVIKVEYLCAKQIDELYDYVESNFSAPQVGLALMLGGGFKPKNIVNMRWRDIKILGDNYVIISNYISDANSITKDYSRPLAPRAARLITKLYNLKKSEVNSESELLDLPVITSAKDSKKPYTVDAFTKFCNSKVVDNFITYDQYIKLADEDMDFAAVPRLLRKTYEKDLISRCNIPEESGIFKFLTGCSLGDDVTSDSYTAFTSPAGLRYLHDIMQFTDKEAKIEPKDIYLDESGNSVYTLSPPTTRSSFSCQFEVILNPGECINIKCPHGITGHLSTKKHNEQE